LRSARERAGEIEVWADDVPETWRGAADERGLVPWRYEPCASAPWITRLEGELGLDLPPSVRALYLRYRFLPFDLGGLSLMANTGEPARVELTSYVHSDPVLCPYLLGRGLVPFARPATGAYDPVCFDARRRAAGREYPLVLVDHEAVLTRARLKIVREWAPSFEALLQSAVG